jgi:hypothetical protein
MYKLHNALLERAYLKHDEVVEKYEVLSHKSWFQLLCYLLAIPQAELLTEAMDD